MGITSFKSSYSSSLSYKGTRFTINFKSSNSFRDNLNIFLISQSCSSDVTSLLIIFLSY